ncbi:hypothetical protein AK812_SmicGene29690 [Symbiodinium microadriaticum]|uniref:Uncharacterized protein n=1 Tax=Symbiodinium microadriaticum TaxID=2951 RepID=A0A1Q9D183_SYMMI|nr:hypothetical protein AK812_SmicGene29690 [Symbiodinium microadriaticum]CAE7275900.1 unnamed protein product [Symbiodinium sp. KB8]
MAHMRASCSDSGSDPAGVDITRTEVHDVPFQDAASDDDVSVQSDFAADVDISYQASFPGDIEAFLAMQDHDGSEDSNDMEIPSRKPSLQGSSQHLETEHGIERDAIGGAMSVKLVSWADPLKLTPVPVDLVERNAKILKDLYQSAGVHLPPQMEWMFLANLIQQYTGSVEDVFEQVTFYESKQQVYWKHHLKKFFTTKPTDPAVHRYTLFFAHGTNSGGAEGIMNSRYLAPATIADGPSAVGHYSQATNWTDNESQLLVLVLSNRFTRDLNIDGMDIMDVKLSQVTTGGNTNWGLRSLANGRDKFFETFKSRQEAIMAGTLMRALRGDSVGTSGADLNATLTHMTKTKFPGDTSANQSMLDEIRQLQRENARLKSGTRSREARPSASARPPSEETKDPVTPKIPAPKNSGSAKTSQPPSSRRAKAKSSAELPTTAVRSLEDCWVPRNEAGATHDDPDELATLPPRSQEGSPDLAGFSDDVLDEEAPDYADPLETVDSFRPQSENPILDECKLDNFKVATINSWSSSKVGKERMNQVRTAADELSAAMSRLSPGSRPALDAIAVSWGLPVSTAAKVNRVPSDYSWEWHTQVHLAESRLAEEYPQAVTASGHVFAAARTIAPNADLSGSSEETLDTNRGIDKVSSQVRAWGHHWLQFFALWWLQNKNFC